MIWERELGLEDRNLAYALTGIGLSYLAENDPGSALAPLERAFKIREAHEVDPSRRAETRFALARSLWEANRDRMRARTLAEQAREGYAKGEVKAKVAEVDTWLRGARVQLGAAASFSALSRLATRAATPYLAAQGREDARQGRTGRSDGEGHRRRARARSG